MGVTLTGHIDVPADRLDSVRAALPDHIRRTRAEPGCLRFEVIEDAALQGRFHVDEAFTDAAAFDVHQARTKSSPWARITQGIERCYTITGMDIAGMDDEDCA